MYGVFQTIWQMLKGGRGGSLLAGMIVGAFLGLPASLSQSHEPVTVAIGTVATALAGGLAVLLLESRDRHRSADPRWQQRVEKTAAGIREAYPDVPPPLAREAAEEHEQERLTPFLWVFIALGMVSAFFGVWAFIDKVVAQFR